MKQRHKNTEGKRCRERLRVPVRRRPRDALCGELLSSRELWASSSNCVRSYFAWQWIPPDLSPLYFKVLTGIVLMTRMQLWIST